MRNLVAPTSSAPSQSPEMSAVLAELSAGAEGDCAVVGTKNNPVTWPRELKTTFVSKLRLANWQVTKTIWYPCSSSWRTPTMDLKSPARTIVASHAADNLLTGKIECMARSNCATTLSN